MEKIAAFLALVFYFNVNAQTIGLQQSKKLQNEFLTTGNRLGNGSYQQTQNMIALYDSIYYWKLDTSTMVWNYNFKFIDFIYDAHQNEINYTNQSWTNNAWINNWMYSDTYDSNNNQIIELTQNWANNS